jgi:hypothetical protein
LEEKLKERSEDLSELKGEIEKSIGLSKEK